MVQRVASFRNRRYNSYVPACGYAADVIHGNAYEVDFLTPIAPVAAGILNAAAVTSAVAFTTFITDTADAPFGRNVVNGAGGAITVYGKDYLGQGMSENINVSGVGSKAFKWIDSVVPAYTGALTLGFGAKLGLPYRMSSVVAEIGNGANAAVGTMQAPSLVDPQSNITTDPRGMYTPTTALNGSNRILIKAMPYNILNANGNGGLYGIAQV